MKTAIILGGVAPHIELISVLKKKGFYTLLVDYLDNPPSRSFADEFCQISTLDKDAVLKLAYDRRADLIITACVDHANVTMCYVAEKLGLPLPYSYETAINTTDKGRMKNLMKENSIPTSDFVIINSNQIINDSFEYPVVIKPVDNNGSKGVKRADDFAELKQYAADAFALSRKKEIIIEKYNKGIEIQVDCFANNGKAHVIMTKQKNASIRKNGIAMQSSGSLVPAVLSLKQKDKLIDIAQKIANAFCFEHTPFFFQAIVDGDDINVLELSPRIGGGLSYKMLKRQTGFDVMNTIVDSYYGSIDNISFVSKDQFMLTSIVYAVNGIFDHVTGVKELEDEGVIEDFDLVVTPGNIFGDYMDSRNRVGAYFIVDKYYDDLIKKAALAQEQVDVIDVEGKSIKYRSNADGTEENDSSIK